MSKPKLNIKEESSTKKTRSPPKKAKVEQSVPRKKKLKTDAEKTAEKKQPLTFAGVGHIGKLMGRDVELLCENLPVSVGLIEHIHKVRILENIRYFRTCQQIFDVLR